MIILYTPHLLFLHFEAPCVVCSRNLDEVRICFTFNGFCISYAFNSTIVFRLFYILCYFCCCCCMMRHMMRVLRCYVFCGACSFLMVIRISFLLVFSDILSGRGLYAITLGGSFGVFLLVIMVHVLYDTLTQEDFHVAYQ